jgi:hypothetical protein
MDYESLLYVARRHGFRQDGLPPLPQPTALRLLGTEHLVLPVRSEPPFAERMAGDEESLDWPENASLWRMKRTLPRAWIVHEVVTLPALSFPREVRAVDDRTQQVLFPDLRARDFSRMAVVESDRSLPKISGESSSEERCRIRRYEPQRVVVETELASPGLVVLSDAWYPGWKAFVTTDGGPPREALIYRTNRVLRGVWLPAGRHTVDFRFQPTSFYCGAWISAASWLVVLVGGAFIVWRRRHHRTPSAS